ncbi:hypothetical protein WA171_002730 [Blastocystis sp. BT1]
MQFTSEPTFKPKLFDEIGKRGKEILRDDYCDEAILRVKTKTTEGQASSYCVIVIHVDFRSFKFILSTDFKVSDAISMKKLGIDSTGLYIGDIDVCNVLKNTKFTFRGQGGLNDRNQLKAELGLEAVTKKVALTAAIDPINQHYLASCVYSVTIFFDL